MVGYSVPILLSSRFVTLSRQTLQPRPVYWIGLGCSPFARHYLENDLFSSWYLDVSVPMVPLVYLCVQYTMLVVRTSRFPYSDIPGYIACSQLPEAYRSVPRPSSAFDAKASAVSS